jgi:serine protease AprX
MLRTASVRVADNEGRSNYEWAIEGIQWVIDHKNEYNIRVLNFSMSAPVQSPYWVDPVNQALMAAWANGIVVVASAGNGGPGAMSIGVPGNNPYVITVGAFTDAYTPSDWTDDYIPTSSSAGPTHDGFIKPDLVAPGGHIVSTMKPSTFLWKQAPENRVGGRYFKMAGTSQSAAVVSGVAIPALLQMR